MGRPAVFEADDRLSYIDLALDLWVAPDGSQTVLGRDEFDALELDGGTRRPAEAGLRELIKLFADHKKTGLDEGSGFCLIDENNAGQLGLNNGGIQNRPTTGEQQPDHTDRTHPSMSTTTIVMIPGPVLGKAGGGRRPVLSPLWINMWYYLWWGRRKAG